MSEQRPQKSDGPRSPASQPQRKPASTFSRPTATRRAAPPVPPESRPATKEGGTKPGLFRKAIFGVVALVIHVVLGSFFGLLRARPTTASEFTAGEVQEIIRILREDDECRDTRLDGYFGLHNNSRELWVAVLGKPNAETGRKDSPDWTFRTRDGAVSVHVGVDDHSGAIPFVIAYGNGDVAGIAPNAPVDSAKLKALVLRQKRRIDSGDSLAMRKKQEDQFAETLAKEKEKQAEKERELNALAEKEREIVLQAQDQTIADKEYNKLRDKMPFGPENKVFNEKSDDWIKRRADLLTDGRKNGRIKIELNQDGAEVYRGKPELPTVEDLIKAIREDRPIPVALP